MHFMNKARGRHMSGEAMGGEQRPENEHHAGALPDIHIKSHANGHTVHIMHQDGRHEPFEHEHGDTDGIKAHIDEHLGHGSHEEGGEPGMGEAAHELTE